MIHVPWIILFWAVMFTKHLLLRFHLLCHLVWYFSLVGVLVKSSNVYRCGYVLCESLKVWIRWVRKGSWKEREVGKSEVGKNRAKLEKNQRSWKEPSEVGKFLLKLKSFVAVGKFWLKLESLNELGKLSLKLESVTTESGPKWTVLKVDGP